VTRLSVAVMLSVGRSARPDDVGSHARHAEQLGIDALFVGDHLVAAVPILDSTLTLATVAAVTDRDPDTSPTSPTNAPARRHRSPSAEPYCSANTQTAALSTGSQLAYAATASPPKTQPESRSPAVPHAPPNASPSTHAPVRPPSSSASSAMTGAANAS